MQKWIDPITITTTSSILYDLHDFFKKSSRYGMNNLATYCNIYLLPFFNLYQRLDGGRCSTWLIKIPHRWLVWFRSGDVWLATEWLSPCSSEQWPLMSVFDHCHVGKVHISVLVALSLSIYSRAVQLPLIRTLPPPCFTAGQAPFFVLLAFATSYDFEGISSPNILGLITRLLSLHVFQHAPWQILGRLFLCMGFRRGFLHGQQPCMPCPCAWSDMK